MKWPLRLRIALLTVLAAALALAGFAWAVLAAVRSQQMVAVDSELRALAARLPGRGGARGPGGSGMGGQRREYAADAMIEERGGRVWMRSAMGSDLLRSPDWPLADAPVAVEPPPGMGGGPAWQVREVRFFSRQTTLGHWRAGEFVGRDFSILIALPMNASNAAMHALAWRFFWLGLLATGFIAWAGWWIAGRALRPMQAISHTAAGIVAGDWDRRIEPAPEAPEVDRLIASLNRMLDSLGAAREQAGRFSADASHELQTPLAVMQATLEDALAHAPAGSREESLCLDLTEELARMKSITSNLLLLARADAGRITVHPVPLDLGQEVASTIEEVATGHPEVVWETDLAEPAPVQADVSLLRIVLGNVLGNAAKFSPPRGTVRVRLEIAGAQVVLTVANQGPPIPPADRERIFERFARLADDAPRRPGQGLGLALARECARLVGGSIDCLGDSEGWITFCVKISAG